MSGYDAIWEERTLEMEEVEKILLLVSWSVCNQDFWTQVCCGI